MSAEENETDHPTNTDPWSPSWINETIDKCLADSNATLFGKATQPQNELEDQVPKPRRNLRLRRGQGRADANSMLRMVQGLAEFIGESAVEVVKSNAETYLKDGLFLTKKEEEKDAMFYCLLLEEMDNPITNGSTPASVCGMAMWYIGYSTWDGRILFLEDLFLDPTHRGEGSGRAVMQTLANITLALKGRRLVWNVLDHNQPAKAFYAKIGAQILPTWLTVRMDRPSVQTYLDAIHVGHEEHRDKDGGCCYATAETNVTLPLDSFQKLYTASCLTPDVIREAIHHGINQGNVFLQSKEGERRQTQSVQNNTTSNEASNQSHLRMRLAQRQDAASILRLVKALAEYEKQPDAVHATVETYTRDGFGPHPIFYCLLLEQVTDDPNDVQTTTTTNDPCGMGLLYFGYSSWEGTFLYLEDLYVDPAQRGRGGGQAIMYALATVVQRLHCPRFVWQVLDWNKPARRFYDGIGAKTLPASWMTVRMDYQALVTFRAERGRGG